MTSIHTLYRGSGTHRSGYPSGIKTGKPETGPPSRASSLAAGPRAGSSIAGDGGLSLLRSHLESRLGEVFESPPTGDEDVATRRPDDFYDLSSDVSPEATADRIVGVALGFFNLYQVQNPGLGAEDLVWGFREEVLRGIEEGFATARQVLSGLGQLEGRIQANVDATYLRVMSRLEEAFAERLFPREDTG